MLVVPRKQKDFYVDSSLSPIKVSTAATEAYPSTKEIGSIGVNGYGIVCKPSD